MPYQENITVFSTDSVSNFIKSDPSGRHPDIKRGEFIRINMKTSHPHIIKNLIKGLQKYIDNPSLIAPLAYKKWTFNKDGSPTKNRLEARLNEASVLGAIISFTDFSTYKVGTPLASGGFINKDHEGIAHTCNMVNKDGKPTSQYYDTLHNIINTGIISIQKLYQTTADNTKRALVAIKTINPDFLISLGIVSAKELKNFEARCCKQVADKRAAYNEKYPKKKDAEEAADKVNRTCFKEKVGKLFPRNPMPKIETPQIKRQKEQLRKDHASLLMKVFVLLMSAGKTNSEAFTEARRQVGNVNDYIQQNI